MKDSIPCLIALFLLFSAGLFLYTRPIAFSQNPFGDVDSSTHFAIANYMANSDKPIYLLPYFINGTTKGITSGYGTLNGGKLWYPPPYHTTQAAFILFNDNPIVVSYLFYGLTSFAIAVSIFLLIRGLYGLIPAIAASFLMIFSIRDIFWFISGQYPQIFSFAIIPLALFCYFKFLSENKPIYVILTAILTAVMFYVHPQSIVITVVACFIFTIFHIIDSKKFSFKSLIYYFAAAGVLIILVLPFLQFPLGEQSKYRSSLSIGGKQILLNPLSWYGSEYYSGTPKAYWSFAIMNPGLFFIIPLVIIGVILMAIRRKPQDLLLLSWLLAFYLVLHIGIFAGGRTDRFMETELHILGAISAVSLIVLIPAFLKGLKIKLPQVTAIILCVFFILLSFATYAQPILKDDYPYNLVKPFPPPFARMTDEEMKAALWIKTNIPDNSDVFFPKVINYPKQKWFQAVSLKHMDWGSVDHTNSTHIIFDYTDAAYSNNKDLGNNIAGYESFIANSSKPIYQSELIRVYKLG